MNDALGNVDAFNKLLDEARQTPGFNLNQSSTQITEKNADDASGIEDWQNNANADYAAQSSSLQSKLNDYKNSLNNYNSHLTHYDQLLNALKTDQTPGRYGWVDSGTMESINYQGRNGNFDNAGSKVLIDDPGALGNYQSLGQHIVIVPGNKLNQDHIITHVSWDNPNQVSTISGSFEWGSVGGASDPNWNGASAIGHVTSGTIFKIAGAVTTANGAKHDLIVQVSNANATSNLLTVYNKNGSIGAATQGAHKGNNATIDMRFWIDNMNNQDPYALTTLVSDIDGGQKMSMWYTNLITLGGGLGIVGGSQAQGGYLGVVSDPNIGVTYGINHDRLGLLHGLDSYPDGVISILTYGNGFLYRIENNNSPTVSGIAVSYFGDASVQPIIPQSPNAEFTYHYDQLKVKSVTQKQEEIHYHYINSI